MYYILIIMLLKYFSVINKLCTNKLVTNYQQTDMFPFFHFGYWYTTALFGQQNHTQPMRPNKPEYTL